MFLHDSPLSTWWLKKLPRAKFKHSRNWDEILTKASNGDGKILYFYKVALWSLLIFMFSSISLVWQLIFLFRAEKWSRELLTGAVCPTIPGPTGSRRSEPPAVGWCSSTSRRGPACPSARSLAWGWRASLLPRKCHFSELTPFSVAFHLFTLIVSYQSPGNVLSPTSL